MNIEFIEGIEHNKEILLLFSEYTALLTSLEPRFAEYLAVQHYEQEIADLSVKYGRPDGRLYLCLVDGKIAGCIGLRKMSRSSCEMKRLFLRPGFRGLHLGEMLVDRIIADARLIGYREMYLDTIPNFTSAIAIYKRRGFREIERYNDSPADLPTIFMKKEL